MAGFCVFVFSCDLPDVQRHFPPVLSYVGEGLQSVLQDGLCGHQRANFREQLSPFVLWYVLQLQLGHLLLDNYLYSGTIAVRFIPLLVLAQTRKSEDKIFGLWRLWSFLINPISSRCHQ